MRKIKVLSIILGILICFYCSNAWASEVKIIVNGQELVPDAAPHIVHDITMVPVRFVAELCGASVNWDNILGIATISKENETIELYTDGRVLKNGQLVSPDIPIEIFENRLMVPLKFIAQTFGLTVKWDNDKRAVVIDFPAGSKYNPVPVMQSFLTPEGIEITVQNVYEGERAWNIIKAHGLKTSFKRGANPSLNTIHETPDDDHKYVVATLKVKNISITGESPLLDGEKFKLVGSSNIIFYSSDNNVSLNKYVLYNNPYQALDIKLWHEKEVTRSIPWYVPNTEKDLMLIWDPDPGSTDSKKTYFKTQ